MKQKLFYGILIGISLLLSCKKKEKWLYPSMYDLQGKWVEKTSSTFKYRLHFINDSLFVRTPLNIDTLLYSLSDTFMYNAVYKGVDIILISDSVNAISRSNFCWVYISAHKRELQTSGIVPCVCNNNIGVNFLRE